MDDNYFYKAIVNLFSAFLAFITAMAICGIISALTSCQCEIRQCARISHRV